MIIIERGVSGFHDQDDMVFPNMKWPMVNLQKILWREEVWTLPRWLNTHLHLMIAKPHGDDDDMDHTDFWIIDHRDGDKSDQRYNKGQLLIKWLQY